LCPLATTWETPFRRLRTSRSWSSRRSLWLGNLIATEKAISRPSGLTDGVCALTRQEVSRLDTFRRLYNQTRPHRALDRHTSAEAFKARIKALPTKPTTPPTSTLRLRGDTIDLDGKLTIRYAGKLRHLGIGRQHAGTRVRMLINDRDISVLNLAGQLLGDYTIDPNRNYQTRNKT
jgi:hypothetical protein